MEALRDGTPLTEPTIKDIKPNVDMVCGGKHLQEVMDDTAALLEDPGRLARILEPLVFGPREYDVILIDTPPSGTKPIPDLARNRASSSQAATDSRSASAGGHAAENVPR